MDDRRGEVPFDEVYARSVARAAATGPHPAAAGQDGRAERALRARRGAASRRGGEGDGSDGGAMT